MINPVRLEKLGSWFAGVSSVRDHEPCVLMLSTSNGLERASVETFVGQSFEASWNALSSHASTSFRKTLLDFEHIIVIYISL